MMTGVIMTNAKNILETMMSAQMGEYAKANTSVDITMESTLITTKGHAFLKKIRITMKTREFAVIILYIFHWYQSR